MTNNDGKNPYQRGKDFNFYLGFFVILFLGMAVLLVTQKFYSWTTTDDGFELYATFVWDDRSGVIREVEDFYADDGLLFVEGADGVTLVLHEGMVVVQRGSPGEIDQMLAQQNPQPATQRVGPTTAPNSKGIEIVPENGGNR